MGKATPDTIKDWPRRKERWTAASASAGRARSVPAFPGDCHHWSQRARAEAWNLASADPPSWGILSSEEAMSMPDDASGTACKLRKPLGCVGLRSEDASVRRG